MPRQDKLPPVRSINELDCLAHRDRRYAKLALDAAQDLGVVTDSIPTAIRHLLDEAARRGNAEVVVEINARR